MYWASRPILPTERPMASPMVSRLPDNRQSTGGVQMHDQVTPRPPIYWQCPTLRGEGFYIASPVIGRDDLGSLHGSNPDQAARPTQPLPRGRHPPLLKEPLWADPRKCSFIDSRTNVLSLGRVHGKGSTQARLKPTNNNKKIHLVGLPMGG
jgi:hypothetical protein